VARRVSASFTLRRGGIVNRPPLIAALNSGKGSPRRPSDFFEDEPLRKDSELPPRSRTSPYAAPRRFPDPPKPQKAGRQSESRNITPDFV